jgi:demethylmenaquinone methyltransferase/2-methoxy-6-polyprenyl-1,4-benzoquinol methylase
MKNNIHEMFDSISSHYDLLNHLLSLNIDKTWRRKAINCLNITDKSDTILDVACGSGDMSRLIERKCHRAKIIGMDFSLNMLKIAKKKINRTSLVLADVYSAPFKDGIFDKIIVAFGFRNFPDKKDALKKLYRLLNQNGVLCILELSIPEKNKLFSLFFNFYFKRVLPLIGGIVSRNFKAYNYLPASVYNFPREEILKEMILASEFKRVNFYYMTFGLCKAILCYK